MIRYTLTEISISPSVSVYTKTFCFLFSFDEFVVTEQRLK